MIKDNSDKIDKYFHAYNWQLGFNKPANSTMLGIIDLHHTIMFYLIIVFVLVSVLLLAIIFGFGQKSKTSDNKSIANFEHNTALEIAWTIFPSIIILLILVPSLSLLYSEEEVRIPAITLKIVGHQWYWSYEYSDYANPEYNNSLIIDSNIKDPKVSKLEVDNHILLPVQTPVRLLVTSEDVIHSWTIPSLGIKVDAIPGRLNQTILYSEKVGHFYGQCSELCGVGHGFMPIHVEIVSFPEYLSWIAVSYMNDKSLKSPHSESVPVKFAYQYGRHKHLSPEQITAFIEEWYEKVDDFDAFVQFLKDTIFNFKSDKDD